MAVAFRAAEIDYRLPGVPASRATLAANANPEAAYPERQAGFQTGPGEIRQPVAPRTGGTRLMILYPHPHDKPGMALAELIVEESAQTREARAQPGFRAWWARLGKNINQYLPGMKFGDGIEAVYALDLPVSQVDQALGEIGERGFFGRSPADAMNVGAANEGNAAEGETDLSVLVDGHFVRRPWRRVPELEKLTRRIRDEGRLVPYSKPLMEDRVLDEQLVTSPSAAAPGWRSVGPVGDLSQTDFQDPVAGANQPQTGSFPGGNRGSAPAAERLGPERLGPERLGPERLGPERLGPERLGPERLGPEEQAQDSPWSGPIAEPTGNANGPSERDRVPRDPFESRTR